MLSVYKTSATLHTPHFTNRTPHPAPRTPHPAPRTPHSASRTPHHAPRTLHTPHRTPHPAPHTPHPAHRTPHLTPYTPHPILYTPHNLHVLDSYLFLLMVGHTSCFISDQKNTTFLNTGTITLAVCSSELGWTTNSPPLSYNAIILYNNCN